jgi:hypothetical protein
VEATPAECKYSTWFWLNVKTGEVRPFNCGSWDCPEHRGLVAFSWACRVAEASPERMLTLTGLPRLRQRAMLAFQMLVRDIRKAGFRFAYCRFLEVGQKTGMLHYHLAQKGSYIPQRWLSKRAEANGLGRVVDIRKCQGEGPAFYLAKYITKDGAPSGWRKVAYSRDFFAPQERPGKSEDWVLMTGLDKMEPEQYPIRNEQTTIADAMPSLWDGGLAEYP